MITIKEIDVTLEEARRFIRLAEAAKKSLMENGIPHDHSPICGDKHTAAMRRASLDLWRQLSRLRSRQCNP